MNIKKVLYLFIFLIFNIIPLFLYAQKSTTITLVVSGEGTSTNEATKNALKSAIEQTYGTFVSANTSLINDELIKDDIATISSGNIVDYQEISCTSIGNTKQVTIKATVSIGNLIKYAKNKGYRAELSGATFAMNMRIKELNKRNETIAIKNLIDKCCEIMKTTNLFDYELQIDKPQFMSDKDKYSIKAKIQMRHNHNYTVLINEIISTLDAIALNHRECQDYNNSNIKVYNFVITNNYFEEYNGDPLLREFIFCCRNYIKDNYFDEHASYCGDLKLKNKIARKYLNHYLIRNSSERQLNELLTNILHTKIKENAYSGSKRVSKEFKYHLRNPINNDILEPLITNYFNSIKFILKDNIGNIWNVENTEVGFQLLAIKQSNSKNHDDSFINLTFVCPWVELDIESLMYYYNPIEIELFYTIEEIEMLDNIELYFD